eukprot:gene25748-biopygen21014
MGADPMGRPNWTAHWVGDPIGTQLGNDRPPPIRAISNPADCKNDAVSHFREVRRVFLATAKRPNPENMDSWKPKDCGARQKWGIIARFDDVWGREFRGGGARAGADPHMGMQCVCMHPGMLNNRGAFRYSVTMISGLNIVFVSWAWVARSARARRSITRHETRLEGILLDTVGPDNVVGKLDQRPIPSAPSAPPDRTPRGGGRAARGADLRAGMRPGKSRKFPTPP